MNKQNLNKNLVFFGINNSESNCHWNRRKTNNKTSALTSFVTIFSDWGTISIKKKDVMTYTRGNIVATLSSRVLSAILNAK